MKITKDQRRAVAAGLLAFGGLVGTAYATLLSRGHQRAQALGHRLDELRRQADAARVRAESLPDLRARVDGLREGVFRLREEAAGPPLPDRIRALAAKHGAECRRVSPGPTVERSFSEVRSTRFTVRGSPTSVASFVANLGQDLWVRSLESLSYGADPAENGGRDDVVQAEFRLETVHAGGLPTASRD